MMTTLNKAFIVGLVMVAAGWLFPAEIAAADPPEQILGQEYAIQADDWLSKLAAKYLGDGRQWPLIVQATNSRAAIDPRLTMIYQPNLIYPGQIIFIPAPTPAAPPPAPPPQPQVKAAITMVPLAPEPDLALLCREQHPAINPFCREIPMARIHCDQADAQECFSCASRSGLENVQLDPTATTILAPNDGDFDLNGVVVAVKVTPDESLLIPRWPGSKFDFPADYAQKFNLPVGEQLEIPLEKAFELIKQGELIWTGVHGAPGKAGLYQIDPPLTCDPQADFEIVVGPF
jgi:hypothetical protein